MGVPPFLQALLAQPAMSTRNRATGSRRTRLASSDRLLARDGPRLERRGPGLLGGAVAAGARRGRLLRRHVRRHHLAVLAGLELLEEGLRVLAVRRRRQLPARVVVRVDLGEHLLVARQAIPAVRTEERGEGALG